VMENMQQQVVRKNYIYFILYHKVIDLSSVFLNFLPII
jgi:hypothetical protein